MIRNFIAAAPHQSNSATVIFFLGRFASNTVAEFVAVSAAGPYAVVELVETPTE